MQTLSQAVRRHWPLALPAAFLLAPALYLPAAAEGLRSVVMYAVAFALMVLLLARASWSPQGVKRFFTTGPNLALVLFVGWGLLSFVATAPAAGLARDVAVMETLRLVSGAVVFFAVLYRFSSREQLKWVSVLLPAAAIVAALAGLASWLQVPGKELTAAFGNKQLYGGFLALLLPMCVVFAAQGKMDARRALASVATVLVLGALLMTENRSSWIAGALSVLLVAGLMLRHARQGGLALQKHRLIAPVVMVAAALGIFLALAPQAKEAAAHRAGTLAAVEQDGSFAWRLREWQRGWELMLQQPVLGHGIGSYAFTMSAQHPEHSGVACLTHGKHGPSMSLNAHNELVQTGVELGFPGLALYLAFLGAFFLRGFRALGRIQSDTRKWLLIAALGAVAAQCVDSLANPAWRFGEVSPLLWLALGLGMAATRTHRERGEEPASAPVARPLPQRMGRLSWQFGTALAAVGLATTSFAAGPKANGIPQPEYCTPRISVEPQELSFRTRFRQPVSKTVLVTHVGQGEEPEGGCAADVTVEIDGRRQFFRASPTSFTLEEPGDTQVVTFTFTPRGNRRREVSTTATISGPALDDGTENEFTVELNAVQRPKRGPFRPRNLTHWEVLSGLASGFNAIAER